MFFGMMCASCFIERAKDFLIIAGSFAMIIVIWILVMIAQLVWRVKSGVQKIEQASMHMQSLGSLPIKLIERWLEGKAPRS